MNAAWVTSMILLWLAVIVLTVLVLLLYRQFGLSYLSSHSRIAMQGLDLGARPKAISLKELDGTEHAVDWEQISAENDAAVLVFAQPSCSICGDLAKSIADLPSRWPTVMFMWIDGTSTGRPERAVDRAGGWLVGYSDGDEVHRVWEVSATPFMHVVGPSARIEAKGAVNAAADVEELLANILGRRAANGQAARPRPAGQGDGLAADVTFKEKEEAGR